jgi:hypothetical protein
VEIGVVGLAATLVSVLVLLVWLVADLHPDDRVRARPWFLVLGSAIVVFGALVAVRVLQLGL